MLFQLLSISALSALLVAVNGQDCLSEHNNYRAMHGVAPLQYNARLEAFAIKRAEHMASTDIFAHPSNLPYGENLYWRSGRVPSCTNALDMWYREVDYYNFRRGNFSPKTGHFTQMIWKDSRYVGCASAKSRRSGRIYIACNYYPPGNVIGRFKENVPQARKTTRKNYYDYY